MRYFRFVLSHLRLLGFGFLLTFFAGFGQTYFIAQYSAELRALYGLTHTGFGTVYGLATLTSAVLLVPVGAWIDQVDLRFYTLVVILGLITAAVLMALAPPLSVVILYVSILLLRLCGQGLMSHIAVTTMARSFVLARGRAISLAVMGHPSAEAVLPLITVFVVALLGWRASWGMVAILLLVVALPLVLILLSRAKGEGGEPVVVPAAAPRSVSGESGAEDAFDGPAWARRDVLRDWRFYLLLPSALAPGFVNTAVFFAQIEIVEQKGWARTDFALGFTIYAAATIIMMFLSGFLVDRFRAVRVYPAALIPLGISMTVLGLATAPGGLFLAMAFSGLSQGMAGASSGALWAELYGTRNLGAIRSMAMSIMVFSTALAPAVMGFALDAGLTVGMLALAVSAYVFCAALLAPAIWFRPTISPRG